MAAPSWSFDDAKEHFFIYVESTGTADLLHELRHSPIAAHEDVNRTACVLYQNVRAIALAASVPYYMSLAATHNGRAAAIQELIEQAKDRSSAAFTSAISLLNNPGAFIPQSFEPLRLAQSHKVMPEVFQALLRQATAMLWGAFESYCDDLFRLLFTRNLACLRKVADARTQPGAPGWALHAKKLIDHIDAEGQKHPPLCPADAYDGYVENKRQVSMSLAALRFIAKIVLESETSLLAILNANEVSKLAARRHLILHAASVVDPAYLKGSGETLPLGTDLIVTACELVVGFRAISEIGAALAVATSALL